MESVDQYIRVELRLRNIPSIAVSVVQQAKIVYGSAFGFADREKDIPATPNTPYYVASVTKALTGAALIILEAKHKIDLDRPANDYLYSSKLHSPMWDVSKATVRRVADHTAGLTTYARSCIVGDAHCQASTQVAIERYGIVFWPPGDHFDYSNLGYGALGQMISDVSGQSLSQFFEREIFRPLQMRNCYLSMTGDIRPGSAVNYDDSSLRQNPLRVSDTPAASSVRCSAHDLAIFGSFVLNTPVLGQKRVLSKARLRELLYSDEASAGKHYSFGWDRNTVEGHYGVFAQGGTEDSFAIVQLIPGAKLSVAVVSNTSTRLPDEIVNRIVAAVLPAGRTSSLKANATEKKELSFRSLVGDWTGTIQTWTGNVPVSISISSTKVVEVAVGESTTGLEPCDRVELSDKRMYCVGRGGLKTPDSPFPPYRIEFELYLHIGALMGAATTADGSELPYWVRVMRKSR